MKCNKCFEEKSIENFPKSKNYKSGINPTCHICWRQYHKDYRNGRENVKFQMEYLTLNGVSKNDYKRMYEIMIELGYDPNNVHEEFCKRHGLPMKKRTYKHVNAFSYEDTKKPLK